uniref:ZP-C domain-containing protein n=1 Tax=Ornithorhynchus anatinus TaxID=9258 RepID=A0A6I8NMH2_ORNAN
MVQGPWVGKPNQSQKNLEPGRNLSHFPEVRLSHLSPGDGPEPHPGEDGVHTINFACTPPSLARGPQHPQPRRPLFSLEVYGSDAFHKLPGPCTVPADSHVFVEAALARPSPNQGLSLRLCFVSPSSDPARHSPFLVLRRGCPAEPSVTFFSASPGAPYRARLSFRLRPLFNASVQFLHCQLGLCYQGTAPHGPHQPPPV